MLAIQHAKQVRDRLWNPPNARRSTELEIVLRPAKVPPPQWTADQSREERETAINQMLGAPVVVETEQGALTVTTIIRVVREYYGITRENLLAKRRNHELVRPRQIIMYLAKEHTKLSLPQIGARLGRMDHTTVLHGSRKIRALMDDDDRLAAEVENFERDLGCWKE